MRSRLLLIPLVAALAGCASEAEMEARAQKWLAEEMAEDQAHCVQQGYRPGSAELQACVQRESDQRAERKAREEQEERERIKAEMEYVDPH